MRRPRGIEVREAPQEGRGRPATLVAPVSCGRRELAEDIEEAAIDAPLLLELELGGEHVPVVLSELDHLDDAVRRYSGRFQAGSQCLDRLVVEAVDLDLVDAERGVEP